MTLKSPWLNRLSPTHQLFEMASRRFEYFVVAAATWCCLDDGPARLAAVTAASLSNQETRDLMLTYLETVAESLEGHSKSRIDELMPSIQRASSPEQKRALRRELKLTNRAYYDALATWYADPDVFVRSDPEIKDMRAPLPEWLIHALENTNAGTHV